MITRVIAIQNLKKYIGQDLSLLADGFKVTRFSKIGQNKGWKGLVLERCAGLENNNVSAPNGIGFELKSVAFETVKGIVRPRETMAITMINPEKLLKQEFFDSGMWEKLKSLVFCAVEWKSANDTTAKLMDVTSFDFQTDENLINEIKADYDFIRNKLKIEGFQALTGKDGKWIQARTKGAGHGSTSRAFYARKELVKKIFNNDITKKIEIKV